MTLEQFLSLGETHQISPDEAQKLNLSLSKASIEDIPGSQRGVVLDYLVCALNMDSVEVRLVPDLDGLRMAIENDSVS